MEIDIDKLINSIKMRPALYNKDNSMYYSHKKYKYKLWREVCEEVYKNWNTLTPQEKVEYARDVQKRWKSLRTCFSRELAYQRKEKLQRESSGEPVKKRKKYEYFNSLTFLLSPELLEDYNISKEEEDSDADQIESRVENGVAEEVGSNSIDSRIGPRTPSKSDNHFMEPVVYERVPLDEKLVDMFKDIREAENDEDRQFALSLVSMFKSMDNKKKLEARIEVLKLLQRIIYREDESHQYI